MNSFVQRDIKIEFSRKKSIMKEFRDPCHSITVRDMFMKEIKYKKSGTI
jgi:hypothetical protein